MTRRRELEQPHILTVKVERKVHDALKAIAYHERRSLGSLVREACRTLVTARAITALQQTRSVESAEYP
jgi:hypothetical protein